jgi:hypothetical protein
MQLCTPHHDAVHVVTSRLNLELVCRLAISAAFTVPAWIYGYTRISGKRTARKPPVWWIGLCWVATAAWGIAAHLALDSVSLAIGFETMAHYVPGT